MINKIIEEYKKAWPGVRFCLYIVAVWLLIVSIPLASGIIAHECFGLSKTNSTVIVFVMLVPWGCIISPVIRHIFEKLLK